MPISQSGTAYDNAASVQRALTVADGRHSPRRHRADEQDHQRAAARAPPIDRHLRLSPLVTSYARRSRRSARASHTSGAWKPFSFLLKSGAWRLYSVSRAGAHPGRSSTAPLIGGAARRQRPACGACARALARLDPRANGIKPPIGRRGTRRVGARAREDAMAMPWHWHPGLARTRKPEGRLHLVRCATETSLRNARDHVAPLLRAWPLEPGRIPLPPSRGDVAAAGRSGRGGSGLRRRLVFCPRLEEVGGGA